MNEEEKKAIEVLDNFEPDDLFECAIYRNALDKLNNLIEKQQKEIEKLKNFKEKIEETLQCHFEEDAIQKICNILEEE